MTDYKKMSYKNVIISSMKIGKLHRGCLIQEVWVIDNEVSHKIQLL